MSGVKRTLKLTLLLMDIAVLILIFMGVIFLFDFVIKDILIKYNFNKFVDAMKTAQFDLKNSMAYIDGKSELPYEDNVKKVFEYLKISSLKKAKYDNSVFITVFPGADYLFFAGKRNDIAFKVDLKKTGYDFFKNKIEELHSDKANKKNKKSADYINFSINGSSYIGTAVFSETGIKKDFKRENSDMVYPILIMADRSDEFFFIIERIRNIFLIMLVSVFLIGAYLKITTTIKATNEIKQISENISLLSQEIKSTGIITSETKRLKTVFKETYQLDNSFNNLVKSLVSVGDIISGIADKDLFAATLKGDNSLLIPHEENMSVIFLDIQGFTSISEKFKNSIMNIINSIWKNIEKVIKDKNGKINKYIGDASLIILRDSDNKSGMPTALNAFYAAVELLEKVPNICRELNIEFNFRIGIDYGRVTYGKTGTDSNFELGVIGDPVNTASRLEALNKQYQTNFLMTETAFNAAGLDYNTEIQSADIGGKKYHLKHFKIDKVRPKGKMEAKELFTVLKKCGEDNKYCFLGSSREFSLQSYNNYEKLLNTFIKSIDYWKKYDSTKTGSDENNAKKNFISIAKAMGDFYHKVKFPPIENFIKAIVKYEEFDEFKRSPEAWLKKENVNIKIPDFEWIKSGFHGLEK